MGSVCVCVCDVCGRASVCVCGPVCSANLLLHGLTIRSGMGSHTRRHEQEGERQRERELAVPSAVTELLSKRERGLCGTLTTT